MIHKEPMHKVGYTGEMLQTELTEGMKEKQESQDNVVHNILENYKKMLI